MAQTFVSGAAAPNKQSVVLLEIDIGQLQDFLTNYSAGTWYVNFDVVYPNIDSSLLVGVAPQAIQLVGSVTWDGADLSQAASIAACEATDSSFFFSDPELYIHGPGGHSPVSARVLIGVSSSAANFTRYMNNQVYEPRLRSVPNITRSRDPVFFGKVSFDSAVVTVDNTDGEFDQFGEDNDVFGNAARLRLGFDDSPIGEYRTIYEGFIETLNIGRDTMRVQIQDNRKKLQRSVGINTFNQTDHPDLDPDNAGHAIPLVYGVVQDIPCVVTNELESGTPSWTVQIADPIHNLLTITEVYVEGVAVVPASTDLTLGTATLDHGYFTPGDQVTADVSGYEESASLIENALDVIKDLLTEYFAIDFTPAFFNVPEWSAATILAPDLCLFVAESTPVLDLIEDISSSVFGSFLIEDAGTFTYKIFADPGSSATTLGKREILDFTPISYDPSEAISSTRVGHTRRWNDDEFEFLVDTSQETVIFNTLNQRRQGDFDTLLVSAIDAQAFSDTVLELQGGVRRLVSVTTKLISPAIDLAVGDFVNVELNRPERGMLNFAFCEVLGVTRNLTTFEVQLDLRILTANLDDPREVGFIAIQAGTQLYTAASASLALYGDGLIYGGAT